MKVPWHASLDSILELCNAQWFCLMITKEWMSPIDFIIILRLQSHTNSNPWLKTCRWDMTTFILALLMIFKRVASLPSNAGYLRRPTSLSDTISFGMLKKIAGLGISHFNFLNKHKNNSRLSQKRNLYLKLENNIENPENHREKQPLSSHLLPMFAYHCWAGKGLAKVTRCRWTLRASDVKVNLKRQKVDSLYNQLFRDLIEIADTSSLSHCIKKLHY